MEFEKKELKKIKQKPAEEYSFNIESELFHQLTKEQQELWKKEIEQAYNAGVEASDEWSKEDETKMRAALAFIKSEFPKEGNEEIMEDTIEWLKSLKNKVQPQPKQEWSEEEQNRFAKCVLTSCASSFIDYLDAHKNEGKMCVSNGECEDIENAFHNAMWDRIHRYYCKYIEKQGEQINLPKFTFDDVLAYEAEWGDKPWGEDCVEYTRTDVIVEKACEWLRENKDKYLYNTGGKDEYIPTCSGKMIDDFRKYMKGE